MGQRSKVCFNPLTMSKLFFFLLVSIGSYAQSEPAKDVVRIQGIDLLSNESFDLESFSAKNSRGSKGYVLVFLSALCPCSNSHVSEVKTLYQDFKSFQFIGVHSNQDEAPDISMKYFKSIQMPFPILADANARLADEFKAYKTPHAFVLSPKGKVLYQGGVTSSALADQADKHFLREALQDLDAGKNVRMVRGRTLGCVISRSKSE
jgi:hypothetical protein